jgi:hypothetical protein
MWRMKHGKKCVWMRARCSSLKPTLLGRQFVLQFIIITEKAPERQKKDRTKFSERPFMMHFFNCF